MQRRATATTFVMFTVCRGKEYYPDLMQDSEARAKAGSELKTLNQQVQSKQQLLQFLIQVNIGLAAGNECVQLAHYETTHVRLSPSVQLRTLHLENV